MTLRHISSDQIEEASLQKLIDTGAPEIRDIEYKSATYGGNDDARAEFLADVSSMANTVGGDLIIGMAATGGVPTALVPLKTDVDAECLRLESMARDGLEPRISKLQTRAVPLSMGGAAIVIRVPRSYNPPHRVVFKGKNRFWARSSNGKYQPNVDELRALFTLAPQLVDRIRNFRMDRIAKIAAAEAPVALTSTCCLVMHLVPFSAFDVGSGAAVSIAQVSQHAEYFPPLLMRDAPHWRINFDGFLALSNSDHIPAQRAYVQVFRSGTIEAVATIDQRQPIDTFTLDAVVVRYARKYASALHTYGVEPPLVLLVSLIGAQGLPLRMQSGIFGNEQAALDRDQLHFSEVIFEEVPQDDKTCGLMVRNILDQLANAAGRTTSSSFDATGNFTLKI